MANAREIQSRMKSIKDTMKITNAMYMISSSKLSKARTDLKNTEPYFFTMQDALAKIPVTAFLTSGPIWRRRIEKKAILWSPPTRAWPVPTTTM